jgi:hypothetical protein
LKDCSLLRAIIDFAFFKTYQEQLIFTLGLLLGYGRRGDFLKSATFYPVGESGFEVAELTLLTLSCQSKLKSDCRSDSLCKHLYRSYSARETNQR